MRHDILRELSLCLSGFQDQNQKAKLHKVIVELGGVYSKDLLTTTTTHLIMAENPARPTDKYREAIKNARIEIVHYKWLEMCSAQNRIIPTHDYKISLRSSKGVTVTSTPGTNETVQREKYTDVDTTNKVNCNKVLNDPCSSNDLSLTVKSIPDPCVAESTNLANRIEFLNLRNLQFECLRLSQEIENDSTPCPLFLSCNFYFAGFQDGAIAMKKLLTKTDKTTNFHHGISTTTGDSTWSNANNSFLYDLQELVRSYMGTISWNLKYNNITHIVIHPDYCQHSDLRLAILNHRKSSPSCPIAVTPHWIVESIEQKTLVDPQKFYLDTWASKGKATTSPRKKKVSSPKKVQDSKALFEGVVFFIVCSSVPDHTVNFDEKEVRHMIQSNGGILLTKDLINIRRKEMKSKNYSSTVPPICFLVHISGCFHYEQVITNNVMLSQIDNHNLYQLAPVNPIWIHTCLAENIQVQAHIMPFLFQPQSWALRLIPQIILTSVSKNGKRVGISVSVSGFQTHERSGIQQTLFAIGAKYTDNLPITNTHLICHPNAIKGPKATKAMEWGLYVVTVDWLYHILKYGYNGENNDINGCEHRFSFINHVQPPIASLEGTTVKTNKKKQKQATCAKEISESHLESEEYDTSPHDSTQHDSYSKSTVFADIACPTENTGSGIHVTRAKRRRKIVLDTQCAKEVCGDVVHTNTRQDVTIDDNCSEDALAIRKKSRLLTEEGDESQNIWWGTSNFDSYIFK